MAYLDSIRKDMVIPEKTEFANLQSENMVPVLKSLFIWLFSFLFKHNFQAEPPLLLLM